MPTWINDTQYLVLVPLNIAQEGDDDTVCVRSSTVADFVSHFRRFMPHEKPTWSPTHLLHVLGVWGRINRLTAEFGGNGNILTVDSALCLCFDNFCWWLEEVPGKVCLSTVLWEVSRHSSSHSHLGGNARAFTTPQVMGL